MVRVGALMQLVSRLSCCFACIYRDVFLITCFIRSGGVFIVMGYHSMLYSEGGGFVLPNGNLGMEAFTRAIES